MDERVAHLSYVAQDAPPSVGDPVPSASLEGCWAGPYRLDALIGQGATGSVYLGEHPHIGAQVAIKILHEDVARIPGVGERFVREARASNLVDSPHVLHIRDFGKLADGRDYAVMDYLRGQPLDSLIEAEGAMDLRRALRLLAQVASGLAAAHQSGVLHRDIKPSNLFVTMGAQGEHIFILDFGIAKLLESHGFSVTQTEVGILVGTPGYCAPEQALHQDIGPAADVYALATVGYEMLTGRSLFTAASVVELLADKVRARTVNLSGLPEGTPSLLHYLFERMLSLEPAARPSMWEVESQLHAILDMAIPACGPLCASRRGTDPPDEGTSRSSQARFEPASVSPVLDVRPSQATRLGLAPPAASSIPPDLGGLCSLRPVAASERPRPRSRTRTWLVTVAGGLVVGGFGLGWLALSASSPQAERAHPSTPRPLPAASVPGATSSSDSVAAKPSATAPMTVDAAAGRTRPGSSTLPRPRPPRSFPPPKASVHDPSPPPGLVDPFAGD